MEHYKRLKKFSGFFDAVKTDYEISKEVKTDVVVVGAGVMGATIAKALRDIAQLDVLVIDKNDPEAGSIPCGGLMKPSKFTGLGEEQYSNVVGLMEQLFHTKQEKMIIKPSGNLLKTDIRNVSMDDIFGIDKITGIMRYIDTQNKTLVYEDEKGEFIFVKAKLMVLAMGAGALDFFWELFNKRGLIMKRGFSFHFEPFDTENFVKFWAPYKQITVHKTKYQGKKIVWAGEGSALTLPSWYDGRIAEGLKRIETEIPKNHKLIRTVRGIRVFHRKQKPCYNIKIDNSWFVSGSGKMGLISAGYSALFILKSEFGINFKKS